MLANRTSVDFAGLDDTAAAAILGQPFWNTPWWAGPEAQRERLRAAVGAAARGTFVRFEAIHLNAAGDPRSIDFSLKPVRAGSGTGGGENGYSATNGNGNGNGATNGNGEVLFLIAEGRDVTELRHVERENVALEERLYRARRLESIGRLAGGVAHDFNNLITAILGSIEVVRQVRPGSDESAEALDVIDHAAQSAAQLTQRLTAFGRRQTRAPEVIDPAAYLDRVEPLLGRVLGEGIALELRAEPGIWPVRLDVTQLEQVFLNLAANARDAMPRGGKLTISAQNVVIESGDAAAAGDTSSSGAAEAIASSYVQLRFIDTGLGMSPSVLERIFEPFYTTKEVGKGTGLGLAAVYGIVRQNGGYIEARSTPGQGSELRLLLPRADDASASVFMPSEADAP